MDASPPQVPYLLDTPILVHYIRRDSVMLRIEAEHSLLRQPLTLISVVTEGEVRSLALKFGWGTDKLRRLHNLLDYHVIVPIPYADIVDAYARIDRFSEKSGRAIGKNDLWIAATANVTGARLITTDHDFDHLAGAFLELALIDPHLDSH